MNHHHNSAPATGVAPCRRPVSATFRLRALVSLNRLRRRLRPRATLPHSKYLNAHLS